MSYCTYAQLEDRLGVNAVRQFFDEDLDNDTAKIQANFQRAADTAQFAVDGPLAAIYSTPLSPVPPLCVEMNLIFLCEMLYQKRLVPGEKNDFKAPADMYRKQLQTIRENGTGLDYKVDRGFFPGAAILEVSRITGSTWNTTVLETCPTPTSL